MALKAGTVRDYAEAILEDTNNQGFSEAFLLDKVNAANLELWRRTIARNPWYYCKVCDTYISYVADQEEYSLASDFYRMVGHPWRQDISSRPRLSRYHLDNRDEYYYGYNDPLLRGPIQGTQYPTYSSEAYYLRRTTAGTWKMGITPIPPSAVSNAVGYFYIPELSNLTGADDPVFVPDSHWEVIAVLTALKALPKKGARNRELERQYQGLLREYLRDIMRDQAGLSVQKEEAW